MIACDGMLLRERMTASSRCVLRVAEGVLMNSDCIPHRVLRVAEGVLMNSDCIPHQVLRVA